MPEFLGYMSGLVTGAFLWQVINRKHQWSRAAEISLFQIIPLAFWFWRHHAG